VKYARMDTTAERYEECVKRFPIPPGGVVPFPEELVLHTVSPHQTDSNFEVGMSPQNICYEFKKN